MNPQREFLLLTSRHNSNEPDTRLLADAHQIFLRNLRLYLPKHRLYSDPIYSSQKQIEQQAYNLFDERLQEAGICIDVVLGSSQNQPASTHYKYAVSGR